MPTYEYRCRDCGHTFDIVQSMKDDALTVCPECGGQLRKVFGAPMISFKGSGFYATDHGKKSRSSERASEQKDGKQGGDGGSKPAADTSDKGGSEKGGSEKKSGEPASPAKESAPSSKAEPKSEPKTPSKKESST